VRTSLFRLSSVFFLFLFLFGTADCLAQTGTIAGRVVEAATGEPLAGATVQLADTERGTATDAFGRFVLSKVPPGSTSLRASFVGYVPEEQAVTVEADARTTVTISLTENTAELAEVVVRSEKFVRNVQETQTSVGVVTEEEIEAIPVRDWEDAALLVGNVSTSGFGAFTIRGIPNVGVGGGGNPTATLYIDGVPQGAFTTSRTIRGMWDVEAVEVFRGPQSTVSGRNALAGAVYVRSAAPSFDWGAAARVRGGNQEAFEGALMITGPIIDDQLAVRVSAESGTQDTGVEYANVSSDDDGFDRTNTIAQRNVRTRLLATPAALPGFSALLNYTYAYDRPHSFLGVTDLEDRTNNGSIASFTETTLHNTSLEMSYDLTPALTVTSITGAVVSDYAIDQLTYQTTDPDATVGVAQRSQTDGLNVTQELRMNYETGRTQAVLGGYYGSFAFERDRLDQGDVYPIVRPQLEQLLGSLLPPDAPFPVFEINFNATTLNDDENENVAVFGEVNREVIADRLTLTAGLRYDRETFGGSSVVINPEAEIVGSPFPEAVNQQVAAALLLMVNTSLQRLDAEYEAFLPKVGAVVDLTRDVSLGATVQRGYRAGGSESLPVGGTNVFDPEFTWNYEVAFRSRWLGGRLLANANVFYTDWQDQQVNLPIEGTTGLFQTENAGESTLYGGELELRAIPATGLTLYGSLGLTHTEFDDFASPTPDDPDRNLAGFDFPGAPGETFSAGAIYEDGAGPFGGLNVSYVGENYSAVGTVAGPQGPENDPDLRAGEYTIVDAQVGYVFDVGGTRARLTAFARNLFDETAPDLARFDARGRVETILRPPRVVGLTLNVNL
jgi:outer membrane receptor protein involved in Fe transport